MSPGAIGRRPRQAAHSAHTSLGDQGVVKAAQQANQEEVKKAWLYRWEVILN